MEELVKNGYLIIPPPSQLSNPIVYDIKTNIVDNNSVKWFTEHTFLPHIKEHLDTEPIRYNKFRYSDNNNVDAQTFHSDVYNYSTEEYVPIFTCLFYFDDSSIELIPRTHLKNNRVSEKCIENYNKTQILDIPSNSILVINSVILHRGRNFVRRRRRLLQVFNCFLFESDFERYSSRTMMIDTHCIAKYVYPKRNSDMYDLSIFLWYLITYFDLQYKILLIDLPSHEKRGCFIGYVSGKSSMFTEKTETNVNVICHDFIRIRQPSFFYGYCLVLLLSIIWYIKYKVKK